eukprot:scaffold7786_cov834-Prasinococcus_capsulatus_cf.AAC.1
MLPECSKRIAWVSHIKYVSAGRVWRSTRVAAAGTSRLVHVHEGALTSLPEGAGCWGRRPAPASETGAFGQR